MNKNLVSIIIPVYNQEMYLDTSIPSVIKQTYRNVEIVIVNDGSTDNSLKIINKYKEVDDRIRIINKENGGLTDAVQIGIREANGDYICFLDSDDRIGSDFIQTFMDTIEENDFVAAGFFLERNEGIFSDRLNEDMVYYEKDLAYWRKNYLMDKSQLSVSRQFYIARWNKMYKTSLLKDIVDDYERCKEVSLGEDSIFTYLVLTKARSAKTISKPNSYYYNRMSQTSMMSTSKVEHHIQNTVNAVDVFSKLLLSNKDSDEQSLYLMFFLIEPLFQRLVSNSFNRAEFLEMNKKIKKNKKYYDAVNAVCKYAPIKTKISLKMRRLVNSNVYFSLRNICKKYLIK